MAPGQGLKPWREVLAPHEDVATGDFSASEFAADLHMIAFAPAVRTCLAEAAWNTCRTERAAAESCVPRGAAWGAEPLLGGAIRDGGRNRTAPVAHPTVQLGLRMIVSARSTS